MRRGWLHLILLTGVGIFTFPFLWMIFTSLKTDDELTSPNWMPAIPAFKSHSPYVLDAPELAKPIGVAEADWDAALPQLIDATRAAIDSANDSASATGVNVGAFRESAAAVALNRAAPRVKATSWGTANLLAEYQKQLTPDLLSAALADRLAVLEIRGLLMRTNDAHIYELCDAKDVATRWKIESGDGQLQTKPDGAAFLRYHFESSSDAPIVLRLDFDSPAQAKDLHKLIFSYVSDNSWHRVDATLQIGEKKFAGDRSSYLAQARAGSILLQPPGFEDDTFKAHIWVPMNALPDDASVAPGSRNATLRLILRPSSTVAAIYGKVTFNYWRAFRQVPFWKYVGNSLILVALCTLGTAFSSTFVAYAFARLNWPGRSVAFVLLLSTMMLPSQVTMIPSFMIWKTLGWYNTLNPLWVPSWLGTAFFIFLMVQHMKSIPRDLEEAARIDGLNALQTWYYVILPLVKPAAAAIAIMTVMGAWNEFMSPLVYLRDQAKFPLSLGLFGIRADQSTGANDWTLLMAGNILMTLPVILMFILFQKYFVQGMTMSGLKG
ncbi:hypothetical protein BH09PLA1_BH09PLA1_18690 [soil metagenome]